MLYFPREIVLTGKAMLARTFTVAVSIFFVADVSTAAPLNFYVRTGGSETYLPLSGGTTVPGFSTGISSDEASWTVTLPFGFDYYGVLKTSVTISANMYLTFGSVPAGAASYVNDCPINATTPNDFLAVFWDDGYPPSTAPVAQLQTKTEGNMPLRRFIIEFTNWDVLRIVGPSGVPENLRVSHQVVLWENGDIEFRYGPRSMATGLSECTNRHLGCSATIGIENSTATASDTVQCNSATVTDGRVIRWRHPLLNLQIERSESNLQIAWPTWVQGGALQTSHDFMNWSAVAQTPVVQGNNYVVTIPIKGAYDFYRLQR